MRVKDLMDGMLCDRCGDPATTFHEDVGNVCPTCAGHWSAKFDDTWFCPQCGEPCPEGGVHERCKAAFAASAQADRDRVMSACSICRRETVSRWSDYLDGNLAEASEQCLTCGHWYDFAYGSSAEVIGRWGAEWHHADTLETELSRIAAREVAILIRRFELGILPPEFVGFAAPLSADPADFTAAKVFADWLDERGNVMDDLRAERFRRYADVSGFRRA